MPPYVGSKLHDIFVRPMSVLLSMPSVKTFKTFDPEHDLMCRQVRMAALALMGLRQANQVMFADIVLHH